jgi:oligosaccharyltransferase complex subunit alpha (ribophorin I)
VSVQYGHDAPVLALRTLRRAAEISHWGANLNIQDEIELYNAGPACVPPFFARAVVVLALTFCSLFFSSLKGQFSRLEYQSQVYFNKMAPHILKTLTLQLPAGVRDAYFTDLVGNVSTSKLRVAPAGGPAPSVLELRPRYPLLGGWNYTFTLGWDAPLGDAVRYDAKEGKYVVGVPIMTSYPGAVVDDAHVKIILPEGAT